MSFHFSLQESLQDFLQDRSTSDKLPQLLFSLKCLNFFRIEGQFCQISFSIFFFLNMASHFLLVSDHKLAVHLIELPLYMTGSFIAAFKILLSTGSFFIMCLSVDLFEFILGVHWAFYMCRLVSFIKCGGFQLYFLKYLILLLSFFFSFQNSNNLCTALLDGVPPFPQALFICLHSFFFLLHRLDNIFKFPDFFAYSNLLLNPYSEFFISAMVLFSPVYKISFYLHSHFIHTSFSYFSCLFMIFLKQLGLLKLFKIFLQ